MDTLINALIYFFIIVIVAVMLNPPKFPDDTPTEPDEPEDNDSDIYPDWRKDAQVGYDWGW